ncbi:MAG: PTS glucitol/sorbitol transporter subunit IIA [Chloroflexales bacterium]|nr:PTS glucitol/sorbitol transporter subunit IIA [Chloroflexales bacterium]
MSTSSELIYDLEVTTIGSLVGEFTAAGIWVFFHERAPSEIAEFAILHRAEPPQRPIIPSQILEVGDEQYVIQAVGDVANNNVRELGHLVLKANGLTEPELPGDVCIEARPLPEPTVGTRIRIWMSTGEDAS